MKAPATRKSIIGWCLFDFANSPFTTLVVTFVYAAFFTKAMVLDENGVADENAGTALWSLGVTVTAVSVALLSPIMGALADGGGHRKRFMIACTLVCIVACVGLFFPVPGQALWALILFVIANIAFEMGMVFYNAFLPEIAPADRIGRISGIGWGLGYFGGLLALVVALFALVQTDAPVFGFSKEVGENIRATNLMVAGWFLLFSIPVFMWLPKTAARGGSSIKGALVELGHTFKELRRFRQIIRFLIARLIYNDGLITVFAFGGIYAAGTFDFSFEEILVFGIVLNVTAGLGAFAMGFLEDRLGGKRTISISLWGLLIGAILAVIAPDKSTFWVAGILVGIFSGPNQSASRSLMGRFVPPSREAEFFGFFAFSGKATAFLGPFMLGRLTEIFESQRAGVSIVVVMLLAGMVLLARVDEAKGMQDAKRGG